MALTNEPRLIGAIAYDVERNLGAAYNRFMEGLHPGDWCVFLDHDAMWTTGLWRRQLLDVIRAEPRAGLLTAVTKRIGRKTQIAPGCPTGHDLREHFRFGARLLDQHGSAAQDITRGSPISGVVMALSRETWESMGGFRDGFFGVDNCAHTDVRKAGKRVLQLPGLYVYHWYRADGVGHKNAPRAVRG